MAGGEHIYATLLLSDSYLPGALVLAHSLRDAQTKYKLAVLVTLDSLSAETISQLNAVYDYVLPVPRIRNASPGNLYLMNRGDLHSAFTKVNLWRLVQFSKIVYIDADVVAYRAPDELFSITHDFAAAPDIGWPDLFNSGVMVLKPNLGDYYAMIAMAERGISFDGADQGLLNMHFKDSYHRLSFTYNVTPSAHYQYVPAYRHFQSSINMVHFIGADKPWFAGRHARHGSSPFEDMVGRWWAVYDRHYRAKEAPVLQSIEQRQFADFAQHPIGSTPEHQTLTYYEPINPHGHGGDSESSHATPAHHQGHGGEGDQQQQQHHHDDTYRGHDHQSHHHEHQEQQQQEHAGERGNAAVSHQPAQSTSQSVSHAPGISSEAGSNTQTSHGHDSGRPQHKEHKPEPIQMSSWDAQWQPPPTDSKPEALNFPVTHYSMSDDAAPYIPPQRYPSPPKNMWYEVPKEPPGPAPKPVFPWEGHQPRPSRSFPVDPFAPSQAEPADAQPDSPAADTGSNPQTPSTPTVMVTPPPAADWNSFQHSNAWDEIPEINRYVDGFQKFHRRGRSGGSVPSLASPVPRGPGRRPKPSGFKLTDFPTAVERPSLPVTPAPVTGSSSYWAHGEAEDEVGHASSNALPAAQGVPAQSDWNPEERLRELSKLQHAALLRKLSNQDGATDEAGSGHRVIPKRSLPFGSQDFKSPTYVQQAPHAPVISAPRPPASLGRDTSGSTLIGRPATPRWAPGLDSSQDPLLESPLSDPRT